MKIARALFFVGVALLAALMLAVLLNAPRASAQFTPGAGFPRVLCRSAAPVTVTPLNTFLVTVATCTLPKNTSTAVFRLSTYNGASVATPVGTVTFSYEIKGTTATTREMGTVNWLAGQAGGDQVCYIARRPVDVNFINVFGSCGVIPAQLPPPTFNVFTSSYFENFLATEPTQILIKCGVTDVGDSCKLDHYSIEQLST